MYSVALRSSISGSVAYHHGFMTHHGAVMFAAGLVTPLTSASIKFSPLPAAAESAHKAARLGKALAAAFAAI